MRRFLGLFLAVVFSLLLTAPVQSKPERTPPQGRKGSIAGKVTDSSGGVLQGAQISVEPIGITAASDVQGQFLINDLDPGSYTVTVTYVGFAKFTQRVDVTAGPAASLEAKLALESQDLEVLVTADRPAAEVEAVNRERTADNVVQVLPDEVIRSLPNANMADALGRLPSVTIERDEGEGKYVQVRGTEPRLTNTTIDGINVPSPEGGVRQIKFDAIPADIVESVEINKTLQANMDGDGIGGSVNLVTKTAGSRPTVNVSGMSGYTPILGGRGLVETTGTVGKRFGANKKWGALIGGSYDWNGRGIDDIEPVPDLSGGQRIFDSMDIREYKYYRSRWGLAGSADYKIADGSNIYMRGLYSDFHNYGDRWVYSINDNLYGSGGPPSFNDQIRRPDYAIGSVLLGGYHVLATTWYSWDISASRARQIGGVGDRTASFSSNLPASSCQFDLAGTTSLYLPQWTQSCFTEAYTNQSTLPLSRMQTNNGLTAQLNLQGTGAVAKRYHLGSRVATIEIGGKFRNAHKFADSSTNNYFPAGNPPFTLADFTSKFSNSNYYQGSYKLGPNPSFHDVYGAFLASGPPSGCTNNANYSCTLDVSSQFDLIEKVSAGYVMNTVDFNKIRLVAGVRFEGTNLDTSAPILDANGNFQGITKSNGSYVKVLPSASLRFALGHDTYLRTVYARGLSRPNPQDIAQALSFDNTANPVLVSLGNPNLKPEAADNVDVLIEHYINPFGLITAGYFYKNLADPLVSQKLRVTSGSFATATCSPSVACQVGETINAGSAWINGFEAAYLQHLSFMPGPLRGLGFSANYGYTASRASGLPGRSDHPRLLRNAPHTWNVSPTYDRGRVSVRLGLSYNAANIAGYSYQDGTPTLDGTPSTPTPGGLFGPFSDNYFYAHLQVDAQGSLRLTHGLNFVMYGLNINNEVFGFYNGSQQYMVQREYYRPTIAAGIRWSPLHESR